MTPKQRVLWRYPRAYCVQYESMAFVYQEPAEALPRGQLAAVAVLGTGRVPREAWADAAGRFPRKVRATPPAP